MDADKPGRWNGAVVDAPWPGTAEPSVGGDDSGGGENVAALLPAGVERENDINKITFLLHK